eukprot:ctg_227.g116
MSDESSGQAAGNGISDVDSSEHLEAKATPVPPRSERQRVAQEMAALSEHQVASVSSAAGAVGTSPHTPRTGGAVLTFPVTAKTQARIEAAQRRRKQLAAVKVSAADIQLVADETGLDKPEAERLLRIAGGDVDQALRRFIRSRVPSEYSLDLPSTIPYHPLGLAACACPGRRTRSSQADSEAGRASLRITRVSVRRGRFTACRLAPSERPIHSTVASFREHGKHLAVGECAGGGTRTGECVGLGFMPKSTAVRGLAWAVPSAVAVGGRWHWKRCGTMGGGAAAARADAAHGWCDHRDHVRVFGVGSSVTCARPGRGGSRRFNGGRCGSSNAIDARATGGGAVDVRGRQTARGGRRVPGCRRGAETGAGTGRALWQGVDAAGAPIHSPARLRAGAECAGAGSACQPHQRVAAERVGQRGAHPEKLRPRPQALRALPHDGRGTRAHLRCVGQHGGGAAEFRTGGGAVPARPARGAPLGAAAASVGGVGGQVRASGGGATAVGAGTAGGAA